MNANAKQCRNRRWGYWMALVTLCGTSLSLTTTAQAQNGRIGTVLGVPLNKLEDFRRANNSTGADAFGNLVQPNDVAVLHVSRQAGSPINSAIATVSITQRGTGLKAWRVYFPQETDGNISSLYRYINAGDSFTNPRVMGNGGVVQMDVRQPNTGDFFVEDMRFMLIPLNSVGAIDMNLQMVHAQRMPNNFGAFWVHLIAIGESRATELTIPTDMAGIIQTLNSNINVGPGNLASGTSLAQVR